MDLDLVDVDALHQAAKRGISNAWQTLCDNHAHEVIYGFGFHSNFAQWALPTAFTEAGLEEAARITGSTQTDLRWVPGDSPRHQVGQEHFRETNEIIQSSLDALYVLEESEDPPDDADAQQMKAVYDTLVVVLNDLSAEGLFADYPEIVLNLWGMEMGWEQRRQFAHRCNPPDIAERFSSEDVSWDAP